MMKKSATPKDNQQSAFRILVIDDEVDMLANYQRILTRAGHECHTISDASKCEEQLANYKPDLVITDLVMPGDSGMRILEKIHQYDPKIAVILVTAHGSIEIAVEAMKNRAADFLTKPFSVDALLRKIREAIGERLIEISSIADDAVEEMMNEGWRQGIIGVSPAIKRVLGLVQQVSRTDVNVLIEGESGTGKEVFARAIHRNSARCNQAFIPIDCASLPELLLESELFGYRKGAFTGADSDKMGLFEFANKGTLLLDEIGDMPTTLQAKLLRVLQERKFRPIGGHQEKAVDVRVITATNRDLEEGIRQKTFRSDLYYRLNVVTIRLPLLSERPEDIPLLANFFLRKFLKSNKKCLVESISAATLESLKEWQWPGNVRELQNVIERAATLAQEPVIGVTDLPRMLRQQGAGQPAAPSSAEDSPVEKKRSGFATEHAESFFQAKNQLVGDFERDYIVSLLIQHRFNVSQAARAAGCHRRTLYRMFHRHDIDLEALRKDIALDAPPLDEGEDS